MKHYDMQIRFLFGILFLQREHSSGLPQYNWRLAAFLCAMRSTVTIEKHLVRPTGFEPLTL
jgi:hypothetical protein